MQKNTYDPLMLARLYTYFNYQKKAKDYAVNFVNVSGKTTYSKWRKSFDLLSKITEKYGIDGKDYLRYLVYDQGLNFYNASEILNINNIRSYAEHMKIIEQYGKIHSYFLKSANYIVDECLRKKYDSCKEFLKRQILHNTLAEKMLSGKISIYYLASIKNIKDIVSKMDPISRDTFSTLVERADKLNSDVQDAFMKITSQKVNPIKFTDELLFKKMTEKV